ncbi:MAG: hypothetical protein J0L82_10455 [Deltaproteobacteria bacterium]|jgi:phage shock protein A|nr:hypothetical protein [Deltaproteobacteria bacterium]
MLIHVAGIARIITALSLFLTTGCVVAYKTNGVTDSLNTSMHSLDTSFGQVDADFNDKKRLFERTLNDGGKRTEAPYKDLDQALGKMADAHRAIANERNALIADKTALEAKLQGKDRVRSDDPAYQHLNATQKKWKTTFKTIEKTMGRYQEASKEFVDGATKHGFRKVDTNQLKSQGERLDKEYASVIGQIQSKIDETKSQVQKQAAEKQNLNQPILDKIQEIVEKIKAKEPDVKASIQSLLGSLEPNQQILVGPKSKSHSALKKLEANIAEINSQTTEIQALVGKLQR